MARKKRPHPPDRLSPIGAEARARKLDTGSLRLHSVAEEWLAKIRTRLPDEGTAVVTVHQLPRRRFLVSFRASALGETFISEAREDSLEDGIREAGARLFERLGATPPGQTPKTVTERMREIFE